MIEPSVRDITIDTVAALSRDVEEQPSIVQHTWETMKRVRPRYCQFLEHHLMKALHGDVEAVKNALGIVVYGEIMEQRDAFAQEWHEIVPDLPRDLGSLSIADQITVASIPDYYDYDTPEPQVR